MNEQIKSVKKRENFLVFSICYILFAPMMDYLFMFINLGISTTLLIYAGLAIIVTVSMLYCLINRPLPTILLFLVLDVAVLASVIVNPRLEAIIFGDFTNLNGNPLYLFLFWGAPIIPLLGSKYDPEKLWLCLVKWARVMIIFAFLTYLISSVLEMKRMDYVVFAYYVEFPMFICFFNGFIKRKKLDIPLALLGIVTILLSGGRGTFVQLLEFFALLLLLSFFKKATLRKVLLLFVVIVVVLLFAMFYTKILFFLNTLLQQLGINNRILTSLNQQSFFDANGRNEIAENIWSCIKSHPLGSGIFSDRYYNMVNLGLNTYAHNIYLEVLCDFGFLFGGVLVIFLVLSIIKILREYKTDALHFLMIIGTLFIIGKLMFSGSYIVDNMFYFFCGMLYKNRRCRLETKVKAENGELPAFGF